jgi:hypothetical protein
LKKVEIKAIVTEMKLHLLSSILRTEILRTKYLQNFGKFNMKEGTGHELRTAP